MNKMKPILFNTDMVRAILEGRKTVTRRAVKKERVDAVLSSPCRLENQDTPDEKFIKCLCTAPCEPGDTLYVRETWAFYIDDDDDEFGAGYFAYKADNIHHPDCKWRPSIHMPKEAARLFLRVKDVWVERLQDISEEQARAEGAIPFCLSVDSEDTPDSERTWHEVGPALPDFIQIWDSIIKPADLSLYGWNANPWVWVIEFERVNKKGGCTYA